MPIYMHSRVCAWMAQLHWFWLTSTICYFAAITLEIIRIEKTKPNGYFFHTDWTRTPLLCGDYTCPSTCTWARERAFDFISIIRDFGPFFEHNFTLYQCFALSILLKNPRPKRRQRQRRRKKTAFSMAWQSLCFFFPLNHLNLKIFLFFSPAILALQLLQLELVNWNCNAGKL